MEHSDDSCPDCTCCRAGRCHLGPGGDCAVAGEGSPLEGRVLCPCTEGLDGYG